MDKEKLKAVVKNLKSLVNVLESEVYSDIDAYTTKITDHLKGPHYGNSEDDDGYTD